MRFVPTLPRLTLVVWLACLGLLVLMAGVIAFRLAHPHFLPATLLLAIEVVAGLALLIGSSWRLLRGPERLRALRFLLLGLAPLLFLAGYFVYGLNAGLTRQFDINWPIKLLMPLAESLMDLQARFEYPIRTEGAKVVMISTPFPEAEAKVEAMDNHVRTIETRLGGKTTTFRVHWVRGPLLGMDSKAVFGMCMASTPGKDASGSEGLSTLDRHEVAHVAMTSLCPVSIEPPALLLEGWAEANSGIDPTDLAIRAWKSRDHGGYQSVAELSGPEWYGRHEWPVYLFGGPLTNYILDTFGPDRYLKLYIESRPETFPEDCRRILGVTLDELDTAYWADIDQKIARAGSPEMYRLTRMRLGPKVDPVAWKAFLKEYLETSTRLLVAYEHVRLKEESRRVTEPDSKGIPVLRETQYQRSGAFVSFRINGKDAEHLYLAHPKQSFQASRKSPNLHWEVRIVSKENAQQSYRRILGYIDREDQSTRLGSLLFGLIEEIHERIDATGVLVTAFERATEEGRPIVRVVLENPSKLADTTHLQQLVLAADEHFVPLSFAYESREGRSGRGTYEYDHHEGLPVLRKRTMKGRYADGKTATHVLTVLECRFEPIPEEEFDADRLLDGPRINVPVGDPPYVDRVAWPRWYWVLLVAAGVALVGGLGLTGMAYRSGRRS